MAIDVVMTTIRIPTVLSAYVAQADESTHFHIVGDWKTPDGITPYLSRLGLGDRLHYYDPAWMKANGYATVLRLNENHDSLRVVGFLEAVKRGATAIVTVDDDNEPQEGFLSSYASLMGNPTNLLTEDLWVNTLASAETSVPIFPRGFPYSMRPLAMRGISEARVKPVVPAIHQGLTLGDPDIDALTRFNLAPDVKELRGPAVRAVGPLHGFIPVNTQNSAVVSALARYWWAPAWCGRHWDIVAGLIVQTLLAEGEYATYGDPVTHSVRNVHNAHKDIHDESVGATLVERLPAWLASIRVAGQPKMMLPERYRLLADRLLGSGDRYCYHLGEAMRFWQREVLNKKP